MSRDEAVNITWHKLSKTYHKVINEFCILFPGFKRGRDETYGRCELMTWPLTLKVMAPVGRGSCGSSSSIRIPSLKFAGLPFRRYGARCVSALMGLVTLTFDLLTFKLVCESHLRWETVLPNLGTLGLWVLELFAMYATDGRTDRRTDGQEQRLLPPSLWTGHNNSHLTNEVLRSVGLRCSVPNLKV